jgi:hypothetical protein
MMDAQFAIPPAARRVSVAAERLPRWLDGFAQRHGTVTWTATADRVVALASDGSTAWIEVPFPPLTADDTTASDIAPNDIAPNDIAPNDTAPLARLLVHVLRSRRVGVLLVRRGGYAAGVFDGPTLVASKVGSAYVQGTTKAGGWSQQRYARRRGNQASAAFAEAAGIAARILLPEVSRLDALVCGGDRVAIETVLADPRLSALKPLVSGPLLAVPDPRLRVLSASPEQFLAVQMAILP